jgi:hypothetical protein
MSISGSGCITRARRPNADDTGGNMPDARDVARQRGSAAGRPVILAVRAPQFHAEERSLE